MLDVLGQRFASLGPTSQVRMGLWSIGAPRCQPPNAGSRARGASRSLPRWSWQTPMADRAEGRRETNRGSNCQGVVHTGQALSSKLNRIQARGKEARAGRRSSKVLYRCHRTIRSHPSQNFGPGWRDRRPRVRSCRASDQRLTVATCGDGFLKNLEDEAVGPGENRRLGSELWPLGSGA